MYVSERKSDCRGVGERKYDVECREIGLGPIVSDGVRLAASHYVTGATRPLPLTLQRRRRPSGRPWPGRILGFVSNDT